MVCCCFLGGYRRRSNISQRSKVKTDSSTPLWQTKRSHVVFDISAPPLWARISPPWPTSVDHIPIGRGRRSISQNKLYFPVCEGSQIKITFASPFRTMVNKHRVELMKIDLWHRSLPFERPLSSALSCQFWATPPPVQGGDLLSRFIKKPRNAPRSFSFQSK